MCVEHTTDYLGVHVQVYIYGGLQNSLMKH